MKARSLGRPREDRRARLCDRRGFNRRWYQLEGCNGMCMRAQTCPLSRAVQQWEYCANSSKLTSNSAGISERDAMISLIKALERLPETGPSIFPLFTPVSNNDEKHVSPQGVPDSERSTGVELPRGRRFLATGCWCCTAGDGKIFSSPLSHNSSIHSAEHPSPSGLRVGARSTQSHLREEEYSVSPVPVRRRLFQTARCPRLRSLDLCAPCELAGRVPYAPRRPPKLASRALHAKHPGTSGRETVSEI